MSEKKIEKLNGSNSMNSKQEQSEAEKAAEKYFMSMMEDIPGDIDLVPPTTLRIPIMEVPAIVRNAFVAGAAWAAPKWKHPPEYPNEGDLIVIKRVDEDDSWTYHLSRSRRSIPIMSTWMLIETAAPEVEK